MPPCPTSSGPHGLIAGFSNSSQKKIPIFRILSNLKKVIKII